MEQILEYVIFVFQNYGLEMLSVIALIEIILFFLKKPIKLLTSKIQNERLRKLANKSLVLLAFVLSFLLYLLGNTVFPQFFDFQGENIIASGAFSIVIYALGDGVIIKTTASEIANTSKETATNVTKIANEKTATTEEVKSAVDSFKDLCNEVTNQDK